MATLNYRNDGPGGREVMDFKRKLERRGVPWSAVQKVHHVSAVRAVGGGSPGARLQAFNEFLQIMPRFDEIGQRNLIRDRVAARVGYDQVDRYIPKGELERVPVDAKIAELENNAMQSGRGVSVNPGENHAVHAKIHLEDAMQFVQALQQNAVEPQLAFAYLQLQLPHSSQHVQALSQDKSRQSEINQYNEVLNLMREAVENIGKQLAREEEAMMQAQQQQQQGGGIDPQTAMAIQKAQVEARLKMEQAQLDGQIKAADARQKMAIRDAEAAQKIREKRLAASDKTK